MESFSAHMVHIKKKVLTNQNETYLETVEIQIYNELQAFVWIGEFSVST